MDMTYMLMMIMLDGCSRTIHIVSQVSGGSRILERGVAVCMPAKAAKAVKRHI